MTLTKPHSRRAAIEQQITAYWAHYIEAAGQGDLDAARGELDTVHELLEEWKTASNEAS